ncbi:MAG: hypothetical protein ABIF17_01555, partial [Patescibacteria group bacterium]
MLDKTNKMLKILIIIFFAVNVLLMGFLLVNSASAETGYTCKLKEGTTDSYQCPPEGETRIQVGIPGLTSSCTYPTWKLDENGKPVTVASTCYYTESLPDFVRKLYTFSIGLISISAVLMIMIA